MVVVVNGVREHGRGVNGVRELCRLVNGVHERLHESAGNW